MPRSDDLPILPSTHIGELLERYPELEEVLIGMAPAFKKLKTHFCGRASGKWRRCAVRRLWEPCRSRTREQAAQRRGAGGVCFRRRGGEGRLLWEQPEWFDANKIAVSIDESSADPNKMPINAVLQKMQGLQAGQMLELITDFLPAPGIDIMKKKGFQVWTMRKGPERICTYVLK